MANKISIIEPVRDRLFLEQLDKEKIKTTYIRLEVLGRQDTDFALVNNTGNNIELSNYFKEVPIRTIEGRATGGSITVSGSSRMSRAGSLSFTAESTKNDLTDIDNLLSIDKKIRVFVGLENNIDKENYEDIVWIKQGIFVITSPSIVHTPTDVSISLQVQDKMCLLDGSCAGELPSSITFSSTDQYIGYSDEGNRFPSNPNTYTVYKVEDRYYMMDDDYRWSEVDKNEMLSSAKSVNTLIYDIILTLVNNYGGVPIENIYINDVPRKTKQIVRWTGTTNLYMNLNTKEYTTKIPADIQDWAVFEPGQECGYTYVDFVMPNSTSSPLISAIGDNVCTILDKIISIFGNYEYFFDVDGNFVFQEIKNYLNYSYDPVKNLADNNKALKSKNIINESDYQIDLSSTSQQVYHFTEGNEMILSYTNNPAYSNIKNDFHIWGNTTADTANTMHYHMAIKEKPQEPFISREVAYDVDEYGEYTGKIRLATEFDKQDRTIPKLVDEIDDDTYELCYNLKPLIDKETPYLTNYSWSLVGNESNIFSLDLDDIDVYAFNTSTIGSTNALIVREFSIEDYTAKDWRAELYLEGLEVKQGQMRPDIYQQELLDCFDDIYDFKKQNFKDIIHKPFELKYWLDYICPNDLKPISVDVLGSRIKSYQNEKIEAFYNRDIPDVFIFNQDIDPYKKFEFYNNFFINRNYLFPDLEESFFEESEKAVRPGVGVITAPKRFPKKRINIGTYFKEDYIEGRWSGNAVQYNLNTSNYYVESDSEIEGITVGYQSHYVKEAGLYHYAGTFNITALFRSKSQIYMKMNNTDTLVKTGTLKDDNYYYLIGDNSGMSYSAQFVDTIITDENYYVDYFMDENRFTSFFTGEVNVPEYLIDVWKNNQLISSGITKHRFYKRIDLEDYLNNESISGYLPLNQTGYTIYAGKGTNKIIESDSDIYIESIAIDGYLIRGFSGSYGLIAGYYAKSDDVIYVNEEYTSPTEKDEDGYYYTHDQCNTTNLPSVESESPSRFLGVSASTNYYVSRDNFIAMTHDSSRTAVVSLADAVSYFLNEFKNNTLINDKYVINNFNISGDTYVLKNYAENEQERELARFEKKDKKDYPCVESLPTILLKGTLKDGTSVSDYLITGAWKNIRLLDETETLIAEYSGGSNSSYGHIISFLSCYISRNKTGYNIPLDANGEYPSVTTDESQNMNKLLFCGPESPQGIPSTISYDYKKIEGNYYYTALVTRPGNQIQVDDELTFDEENNVNYKATYEQIKSACPSTYYNENMVSIGYAEYLISAWANGTLDSDSNITKVKKIDPAEGTGLNILVTEDELNIDYLRENNKVFKEILNEGEDYSIVGDDLYKNMLTVAIGTTAHEAMRDLLYKYTVYNSGLSISSIPIYYIKPNERIQIEDRLSGIGGDYMITQINFALDGKSPMSISASKALSRV